MSGGGSFIEETVDSTLALGPTIIPVNIERCRTDVVSVDESSNRHWIGSIANTHRHRLRIHNVFRRVHITLYVQMGARSRQSIDSRAARASQYTSQ
jgi:hypothetical protein